MRAYLADVDGAVPVLPDGLLLRRYDESLDAAMMAAHNEAFLDHPNFTPWNDVMWKQWVTGSRTFRPALSFVVVEEQRPDRVVGLPAERTSSTRTTRPPAGARATSARSARCAGYRGRGLASALLRHSLRRLPGRRLDEAALDVDSENPTGALGVYERAGFGVEWRFADYVLDRPAR